jgi:hypothetical protein
MSVFEGHCRDKGLELRRPSKRPALNGRVERAPVKLALRVLHLLRPARAHRQAPAPRRRLRPPIQSPQTPGDLTPESIETTQPEDPAVS